MGCCASKVDDPHIVKLCRERKDFLKAAADHRYALAAAHLSYFISLKDVGEALRRFVDEELVYATSSSSSPSTIATLHFVDDAGGEEDGAGKKGSEKTRNLGGGHGESKSKSNSNSKSKKSISDVTGSHRRHHHHHHHHGRGHNDDEKESHLRFSEDDSGGDSHVHLDDDDDDGEVNGGGYPDPLPAGYSVPYGYGMMNEPINHPPPNWGPFPNYYGAGQLYKAWAPPSYGNPHVSFMKSSSPAIKTVIHEAEPARNEYSSKLYGYPFQNEGFYYGEVPMVSPAAAQVGRGFEGRKPGGPRVPADPPPPPSPKGASAWDFFNPFDAYDGDFSGYYSQGGYGYGNRNGIGNEYPSSVSSPDSAEVRKREGIPDLEEETESEVYREVNKGKKVKKEVNGRFSGEGGLGSGSSSCSRAVPLRKSSVDNPPRTPLQKKREKGGSKNAPLQKNDGGSSSSVPMPSSEQSVTGKGSKGVPSEHNEDGRSIHLSEEFSSSRTVLSSKSPEDVPVLKKEVSFEVDETPTPDVESSKLEDLTALSTHGIRELREVVAEIRDEFAIASSYGKEVALMLEVGKLPYQESLLKVMLSRILFMRLPSLLPSSYQPSRRSVKLAAKTSKMAKSYFGDLLKDSESNPCNLSSTLEKLHAWEKKLYEEVKAEEKLRVIHEKQCKELQLLDKKGAESNKIDTLRASIRILETSMKICMKTIGAISTRIQNLMDEELQPQLADLILGLIRMWKSMLRCHQKQFQALMESKTRTLKANTSSERDSNLRASRELEMELLAWSARFSDWVNNQKSYVESLNGWLLRCLEHEPEITPDGPVPFSPGRIGAPPIFLICKDWNEAMEKISNTQVANALHTFASSLRELWEKQEEEQHQRVKTEDLSNGIKQQLKGRMGREQDAMLNKTRGSIVASEKGIPPHDDLKEQLDNVMLKRYAEEKAKHKDAKKIVHDAASSSVHGGLLPIFRALESFSSEALKAYEFVRLHSDGER